MHTHQKVSNAVCPTIHAYSLENPARVQSTDQVNSNGHFAKPDHVIRSRPIVWHKGWGDVFLSVLSGGNTPSVPYKFSLSLSFY